MKKQLKDLTFEEFTKIKAMGFLWVFHPEATGNWQEDCGKYQEEEKPKDEKQERGNPNFLNKEDFLLFCAKYREGYKKSHEVEKFGISIGDFLDEFYTCVDLPMKKIYGSFYWDTINDWLLGSWDGKIYDSKSGNLIFNVDSDEKLWGYLETCERID